MAICKGSLAGLRGQRVILEVEVVLGLLLNHLVTETHNQT